ncbi:MAG: hypothetical protein GF353_25880 [Candidatus Lokiarchaeota archaeon]|nr:hypothetical protein [Candidatus Lokiarchaeota archaeon]
MRKYLKIFYLIKKYCPEFKLNESRIKIIKSKVQRRLDEKEKLILYLFHEGAKNESSAVAIDKYFNFEDIKSSTNYLYKRRNDKKYYLTESGLNIYRLILNNLTELIYTDKEIDDIFELDSKIKDNFSKRVENQIDNTSQFEDSEQIESTAEREVYHYQQNISETSNGYLILPIETSD